MEKMMDTRMNAPDPQFMDSAFEPAFEPLRIAITLTSPMALPEHPIHLDSLLAALRVEQAEIEGSDDPYATQHDLPLARYIAPDGQWVFKASALEFDIDSPPELIPMTCRTDLMRLTEYRASGFVSGLAGKKAPDIRSGAFKAGFFHQGTLWPKVVTATCVGNKEAIVELLGDLDFLGGRRALAMGRVATITIQSIGEDECNWQRRALPCSFVQGRESQSPLVRTVGALKAPYWDRTKHHEVMIPLDLV